MRFSIAVFLTLSTPLLTNAAPFNPQDGSLQRLRRRAVDYPVNSSPDTNSRPQPLAKRQLRKRSVSYSVVQVDGSSDSASTATVLQTSTAAPSTETVVLTSTVTGPSSEETIVITTTREVQQTVAASASSTASTTSTTAATTNTIVGTVTSTVTPSTSTSSTEYYDNGLWHTYYPIKTFTPRAATAAPAPQVKRSTILDVRNVEVPHADTRVAFNAGWQRFPRRAMTPAHNTPAIAARDAFPVPAPDAEASTPEAIFDRLGVD